jgi:hypothetical protein
MDKEIRRIIHEADRYVRWKKYRCLVPSCTQTAILSHAIQRASCAQALADRGVLYTLQQSFTSLLRKAAPTDPPEVVETGVKDAGVFRGFCATHDALLYRSAEITNPKKKHGMFISLHLRALSLEYCRKRRNIDFHRKFAELARNPEMRSRALKQAEFWEVICTFFEKTYLQAIFSFIGGLDIDKIEYLCLPFSRNLEVSCCGVFPENPQAPASNIAYNLISYADMSILVLTVFKVVEYYLTSFLARYPLPEGVERLVNDIAFSKGEEPLIAARLWRSLSEGEKLALRKSLLPPFLRTETSAPIIVKLRRGDFV